MSKVEPTLESRSREPNGALAPQALLDRQTPKRIERRTNRVLAIVVPAVIAMVLSAIDITARSIWLDESASLSIASQHGRALWHAIARDGGNMSGYYLILHVLISAFGDGLVVLRLPSAISVGVTVLFVSLIASRLFDDLAAFVAGLLTAVSLPLVYWGQDARGYAPMVAFVTASYYFLVVLDGRGSGRARSRWPWIGYVVATTLAAYMSYVAVLAVLAQLFWIGVARRPWRKVASAVAVCVVLWSPLLALAANRGTGQLDWLQRPGIEALSVVIATVSSASQQPTIHRTATSGALEAFTALVVVGLAGFAIFSRRERDRRGQIVLLTSWIAVPVALAFAESYVTQPVFLSRNLLMCVPPVAIVVSLAVAIRRIPRAVGLGALVVIGGLRVAQLAPSYGESSENWRAATAYVIAQSRAKDCVAFYPSDARQAFDYYVLHTKRDLSVAPQPVLPSLAFSEVRPFVEVYATMTVKEITNLELSCGRLWFVSSHNGSPKGTTSSAAHYYRYEELLSHLSAAFVHMRVERFGWADPVRVELFSSARFVQGRSP
ncbi:MAG: glycosyltransferase family 39 protein [Acidimicrobiales bacterium]